MIALAIKPVCVLLLAAGLLVAGLLNVASDPYIDGSIDGYDYSVKLYDQPSEYGVDGGRVSKMEVWRDGKLVVNYDRGWDVEPETDGEREIVKKVLEKVGNDG